MRIAIATLLLVLVSPAWGQVLPDARENVWLRTWIDSSCCVTNNCCFRIKPKDITPLGMDRYQIKASGQQILRTDWSPDGEIWRCACDWIDGKWTVHPRAYTRCLFMPRPNS